MTKQLVLFGVAIIAASATTARAKSVDEILSGGTPEEKGKAIAQELARRNSGYRDFAGEVEMTLEDAGGTQAKRSFNVKVLEGGGAEGDRSVIVFQSPADIKGTAVLTHGHAGAEDEQWLFLPSSQRVKRISSSNRTGSFVGSEFSFEDLSAADPRKYEWVWKAVESCGDKKCLVVDAVPKDPQSAYSRRVLRVDAADWQVQSAEFIDRRGAKLKTLTYSDYQQLGGNFWRARSWSMKNHQSGKSTALRFTAMKVGNKFAASDFFTEKLGNQ